MLVAVVLMGLRRYPNDMPVIGNCSAAISAACHPEIREGGDGEDMVLRPLRWGDVGMVDGETGVRHLSFSDKLEDVCEPIEFASYAGGSRSRFQLH